MAAKSCTAQTPIKTTTNTITISAITCNCVLCPQKSKVDTKTLYAYNLIKK